MSTMAEVPRTVRDITITIESPGKPKVTMGTKQVADNPNVVRMIDAMDNLDIVREQRFYADGTEAPWDSLEDGVYMVQHIRRTITLDYEVRLAPTNEQVIV